MTFQLSNCVSQRVTRAACAALFSVVLLLPGFFSAQTAPTKVVGTVKSVTGSSVVLTTDSGSEVTVNFAANARIVRAAPGQSDLKTAAPIQVSEIQVGDRVATRGQPEGNSIAASAAIVMKGSDIAQRQQQEREEWRRGVGGIVKEANPAAETITIANSLAAGGKPIQIHVSPETTIRRYSPDSVKFDDAKPGTLDQIKPGDQVRARGTKSADGTEFTAQAIVSGTFRDIAGTVMSTNAADNSVTVTDLTTKKPVVVKIGPDSMVRRLPQMMAMGIAMRLKGGAAGASSPAGAPAGATGQGPNGGRQWQGGGVQANAAPGGPGAGRMGGGNFRGGPPDFQQMLARMPAVPISELNKGDAVILVATEGSAGSEPTAITLLAGVEPILSAAPAGTSAAETILSPWNLSTSAPQGAGGDAMTQ